MPFSLNVEGLVAEGCGLVAERCGLAVKGLVVEECGLPASQRLVKHELVS